MALGGITAAGGALVAGFLQKAGEMQSFEAQLRAITGSAEVAKAQLQSMADFAAKTPFELPSVVAAGIKIKALGQDVDKFLPLAGNLAAAMGRDIPDAALALGKALSGSQDGIQVLADSYGITRAEMAKFGAEVKSNGAINVDGAANLDKLRNALENIIRTKFGNTMEEQSKTLNGAFSNLQDSIGQLQAEFGKDLAPAAEAVARAVTGVLVAFKDLDPYAKSLIANSVLIGTVLTAAATAGYALQAVILPIKTMIAAYTVATQANAVATAEAAAAAEALAVAEGQVAAGAGAATAGMTANAGAATALGTALKGALLSVGGIAIAIGALVGGGLILATKSWEQYTEATEKTIAVSKRQLQSFHEQKDVTLQVVEAIKTYGSATSAAVDEVSAALQRMGKDDLDVTKAIAGNMELLKAAREAGNEEEVKKLEERIALLRKARTGMRGMHDAELKEQAEKAEAAKKATSAAEEMLKAFQENQKANVFASSGEELAAMDKVLAVLGKTHAKHRELSLERVALARKASKEEAAEAEKARRESIEAEHRALDLIVGNDQAATEKRIGLLGELLKNSRLNAEEKHKLEVDLARELDSLDKIKADKQKKAIEERKKADEEAIKIRQKLLDAEAKSAEVGIQALQEKFRQGEPVLAQLEEEIRKRDEIAARLEREKAAQEALGKSASARSAILRATNEANAAREKQSVLEIEKLRQTESKRRADQAAKTGDLTLEQLRQEEEAAKKRYEVDSTQFDALKKKQQERQKQERDALVMRAAAESIGASAEDRARIQRDMQLEMNKLAIRQTEEARALTKEQERQLSLAKEQKKEKQGITLGNVGGIETAGDYSNFDITKKDAKKPEDLRAKLEQKQDASKAEALAKDSSGTLEKILAEMTQQTITLQSIAKTPVKVDIKGAATASQAAATETKDYRTSTNKTGG